MVHPNVLNNDFKFFLKLIEPYKHDLTVCYECMFGWCWLALARLNPNRCLCRMPFWIRAA